jgi:hypothetical protein
MQAARVQQREIMMRRSIALFFAAAFISGAQAEDFQIAKVPSVAGFPLDQLKPGMIVFNDYREAEISEGNSGFIRFEDWGRRMPAQKQLLGLYPTYSEGMATKTIEGMTTTYKDRLSLYIAEARFLINKPAASIDLKRYASLSFLEKIDPQINHQVIKPSELKLLNEERNHNNRHPQRQWCEGSNVTLCIRSRYKLEGKIPMGVALANKLRDNERKLTDSLEFENEFRVLVPGEFDEAAIKKLTGIDTPVAGVLEQNIFAVNQILRFGKFLAVVQPHPANPDTTITTGTVALAVSATTLETKKHYEDVPVLRNLVPVQVLLGNSSFNTGSSLSAGLPAYARNRIKATAELLNRE